MFESKEILDLAIRFETNGEATYRKALDVCSESGLRSLLSWMADEEKQHARWFANLRATVDQGGRNPFLEQMGRELFSDVVGGQSFSLKEVDFTIVRSPRELVAIFIEFERDTVLFYEMIAPFIEDQATRSHLEGIVAEENKHIARLSEFLKNSVAETVEG